MFPLNLWTVFHLVLIGVGLFSALTVQFGWRRHIPLVFLALAIPAGIIWFDTFTDQYAWLGYIILVSGYVAALLLGTIIGSVMRSSQLKALTAVALLSFTAVSLAGFVLWRQYEPKACLETPLQVRIAGRVLSLPPELQARLEKGNKVAWFGRADKKPDFSRLCRISKNGTRVIDIDTIWITPASNHTALTSACNVGEPPSWCNGYSSDPYRYIGKILIAPDAKPAFPLPYWNDGGSLNKERNGDLIEGSVCLLPDTLTQCWTWQPFGDGSRLTVSTNRLDQTFHEMPSEEAREIIRRAREITLTIIGQ